MSWDNNEFDHADDPLKVGWFIEYWRILKCDAGCHGDYLLESRSFDHVSKEATREEALEKFHHYVEQKKRSGEMANIKGLTLFLTRVEEVVLISDRTGKML